MFRSKPSVGPLSITIMGMLVWLSWAQQSWATQHLPADRHTAESTEEVSGRSEPKPRLIVLTDMTSMSPGVREPDDAQSMIRLLLYANKFDIEGIIASSGLQHGHVVRPEIIRKIVDAYGEIQPNLLLHDKYYPSADSLRRVIKNGQPKADKDIPVYESIGEEHDTQASDWIIRAVDKSDDRPVWIVIWGGPADLGQALWRVRKTRSITRANAFIQKIRVAASGNQDSTAQWIKSRFPDLHYITRAGGGRGIYRGGDTSLSDSEWIQQNIRGHGALGDIYPDYRGGDIYTWKLGKVNGIKGGDSGTYMGLIYNGLNVPNQLTWVNWGGRIEPVPDEPNRYQDAIDRAGNFETDLSPYWANVYRWRRDFQSDYAARFDWTIKTYEQANHAPLRRSGTRVVNQKVAARARVQLDASGWRDPDGDNLSFEWQVLNEETMLSSGVTIENNSSKSARFTAPAAEQAQSVHVLLTVRDDGNPSLASYQRFNYRVLPQAAGHNLDGG